MPTRTAGTPGTHRGRGAEASCRERAAALTARSYDMRSRVVAVKVPDLAAAESELDASEAVWRHGHAGPREDLVGDALGARQGGWNRYGWLPTILARVSSARPSRDDGRAASPGYPGRLADNAAFLLARLGQETVRPFAHALAPSGLAPREWGLLEVLADGGPGTQAELCARLRLDRGDMTRFVERLEERGLVSTRHDRADRRAKQVAITGSGRGALRRARPLAADAERLALSGLDEDERAELRRLLAIVASHRGAGGGRRHAEDLDRTLGTSTERRP